MLTVCPVAYGCSNGHRVIRFYRDGERPAETIGRCCELLSAGRTFAQKGPIPRCEFTLVLIAGTGAARRRK
jgi:hypothetical protein